MALNTISDSKEKFYKEFPYVIPHIFRKVADEMLVELHLLTHQKNFKVDSLVSMGFVKAFKDLTIGYKPLKHLDLLFNALCNCNNIDPEIIKKSCDTIIEENKSLNLAKINDFINTSEATEEIIKTENSSYNRLTIIGIYNLLESIPKAEKEEIKIDKEKMTVQIGVKLGYPKDRVEKDISLFTSNVNKIKEALELIEAINSKKS